MVRSTQRREVLHFLKQRGSGVEGTLVISWAYIRGAYTRGAYSQRFTVCFEHNVLNHAINVTFNVDMENKSNKKALNAKRYEMFLKFKRQIWSDQLNCEAVGARGASVMF